MRKEAGIPRKCRKQRSKTLDLLKEDAMKKRLGVMFVMTLLVACGCAGRTGVYYEYPYEYDYAYPYGYGYYGPYYYEEEPGGHEEFEEHEHMERGGEFRERGGHEGGEEHEEHGGERR
jgi:hypothetical protein